MDKRIVITAYANDDNASLTNLVDEQKNIQKTLSSETESIIHHSIPNATREDLTFYIDNSQKDNIILFSYSGHSAGGILGTKEELTQGQGIAEKLGLCDNIKVVLLNGCENNVQAALFLKNKIPAVITTPTPINDVKARIFAETFFKDFLVEERSLDDSYRNAVASVNTIPQTNIEPKVRKLGAAPQEKEDNATWILQTIDEEILKIKVTDILVGPKNYILSLPENKNKIKIFCLYDNAIDTKYKYDQGIDLILASLGENTNVVFQTIWGISATINQEAINKEISAADFIFHFMNGILYKNFIKSYDLEPKIATKSNIFLSLEGDTQFLSNFSWYNESNLITNGVPYFNIAGSLTEDNKEALIKDYILKQFNAILGKTIITPDRMKEDLGKMSFPEEMRSFRNIIKIKSPLFSTAINGTPNSAQQLLVNKLRAKATEDNENAYEKLLIDCSLLKGKSDKDSFWELFASQVSKEVDYDKNDSEFSQKSILRILVKKSKTLPLALIFDNMTPAIKQIVDADIWQSLNKNTPSNENTIWFFLVNYDENMPINNADAVNQLNINVSDFTDTDFDDWKEKMFNCRDHPKFKELRFKNITDFKRKLVLEEICQIFIKDASEKIEIIDNLLRYD